MTPTTPTTTTPTPLKILQIRCVFFAHRLNFFYNACGVACVGMKDLPITNKGSLQHRCVFFAARSNFIKPNTQSRVRMKVAEENDSPGIDLEDGVPREG
jgi:hypothetical protein